MDVVLSGGGADELEHLAKVERIVATDLNGAGNEDEHGVGVVRGLNVHGLDCMLHGADGLVLGHDGRTALHLVALKGEHGAFLLLCGTIN